MFVAAGVAYLVVLVWGIVLLAEHTVRSVVLGVVLTVIGLCMVLLRIYLVRQRLAAGVNPITGLPRRTRDQRAAGSDAAR